MTSPGSKDAKGQRDQIWTTYALQRKATTAEIKAGLTVDVNTHPIEIILVPEYNGNNKVIKDINARMKISKVCDFDDFAMRVPIESNLQKLYRDIEVAMYSVKMMRGILFKYLDAREATDDPIPQIHLVGERGRDIINPFNNESPEDDEASDSETEAERYHVLGERPDEYGVKRIPKDAVVYIHTSKKLRDEDGYYPDKYIDSHRPDKDDIDFDDLDEDDPMDEDVDSGDEAELQNIEIRKLHGPNNIDSEFSFHLRYGRPHGLMAYNDEETTDVDGSKHRAFADSDIPSYNARAQREYDEALRRGSIKYQEMVKDRKKMREYIDDA